MPGIDPTKGGKPFLCACLPKSLSKSPTPTPPAKTTSAPPARWTGTCKDTGGRFDKERAKELVKRFCEVAFKNEWSDKWFAGESMLVYTKDIILFDEYDRQVLDKDFKFVIRVSTQSHREKELCEPKGEGSDLGSALGKLRKNISACQEEFGHLIEDCAWAGEGPIHQSHPAGGSRPGLCMEWELYADIDD